MRLMSINMPILLGFLGLSAPACQVSTGRTGPKAAAIVPVGEASQRSLLPADPQEDARRALASRYALRERQFREAYEPGSLWGPLRVEQGDIDAGRVSPAELVDIGRDLFAMDFSAAQGLGNGLSRHKSRMAGPRPAPNLRHVHYKDFGGPDATRCLSCHHLGGEGGGGFPSDNVFLDGDGETPTSGLERNPPALAGAALVQRLAEEMSDELAQQYQRALSRLNSTESEAVPLSAKGISFGVLRLGRGGQVDPTGLSGIDADLKVRPFGRKGTLSTLREAVERSLQQDLGIQPESWVRDPGAHGGSAGLGDGPDPADPDGDGITREATDGMVTAITAYLAALGPPIEEMPHDPSFLLRASQGAEWFQRVGCAKCHTPELPLANSVISLGPYPRSGPRLDLAPLISSPGNARRMATVRLYSDLKRHDMGPTLGESRDYRGVRKNEWLTPPLWGVAASGAYLHDGRASTVDGAIKAHDGEALSARMAYQKLNVDDQGAINLFLLTLDRPHHLEFRR